MKLQGYENGYFVGPTIFEDVKPDMKIYKEEIFGPVLSMMTTDTYEEALKLVNDHELGNGAAVFTKSGMIAKHFTENAKIGMIGVKCSLFLYLLRTIALVVGRDHYLEITLCMVLKE
jgi:malonate-semialdehyde dehydrogenase (acetylating)/methylmalonate-semialdehyde dehydrogenase